MGEKAIGTVGSASDSGDGITHRSSFARLSRLQGTHLIIMIIFFHVFIYMYA